MIAARLNKGHVGQMFRVGSIGGTIKDVNMRLRRPATVDVHIDIITEHGPKRIVLSPSTEVHLRPLHPGSEL